MIYEKWRDLDIDPFDIKFKEIKLKKIISYPPAQNDVIECLCEFHSKEINVFIKIERSKMAELISERNYLNELTKTGLNNIPLVIEFGKYQDKNYIVLSKLYGERLSDIFNKNITQEDKQKYLLEYGRALCYIHKIKPKLVVQAKQRKINTCPIKKDDKEFPAFLEKYIEYLVKNVPSFNQETFIHGDFHYGNILWNEFKVTGLLDWEYSGYGFKEQDIAWACILRPTQHFMDNIYDIEQFLSGYLEVGNCNIKNLYWCLINGYCHFYLMNLKNKKYTNKLENLISNIYERVEVQKEV